jgi:hypothetical protein
MRTLGLLAKDDDVGDDVVVLVSPELASQAHAALNLRTGEREGVSSVQRRELER